MNSKKEIIIKIKNIVGENFLKESEGFVGSRFHGEKVRKEIEKNIFEKKNKVILDFEDIILITQSFGDEIIGILTRAFGKEFIKENIKVINASDKIRKILNIVVNYSHNIYINKEI